VTGVGGLAVSASPGGEPGAVPEKPPGTPIAGRSPGQLAWLRLKRDRTALVSGGMLLFFVLLGLGAPVIEALYGKGPNDVFQGTLDRRGFPLGYAGGVSGEHWLGVTPRYPHDIFINVVYGLRTSLLIAFVSAIVTIAIGVLLGIVAGYAGGKVDAAISWVIDVTLAFPFFIFALAAIPLVSGRFYRPSEERPAWFLVLLLVGIFTLFNWTYTARLVRGQVLSLREREFVEAARAAGAGTGHILFRQLLPNVWAPILVTFSLNVPAFITAEAALSFLGVGLQEPTPDLGRMVRVSMDFLRGDPAYTMITGTTIFLLVLVFNLFGDSLRDALDPKSHR